ncbi:hypothetical protein [uncultured Roseobacter sp.]|uniref:hypothetical protein n=1 Tax=uncultured Roseobacter sp. TaxID=114847 RepID=UPI00260CBF27|nr:hypothetical protein [uncultured Roseobacter sp.]
MQDPLDIETKAQKLSAALEKHLGVKGRSLAHRVRRAGRRLPRRIREHAHLLAEADAVRDNIKISRQYDAAQIARAYEHVSDYLATIDRADARRGRILSILAVLAFNFILLFVAFVVFLRMRGIV